MQFYVPLPDTGQQWRASVIALRVARGTGPAVSSIVRRELNESFRGTVDFTVQPMTERLAPELRPWHAGAVLFTGAGALALLVAMIGVYSSISYTLTQRTYELGVRIALGATAGRILRVVVTESLGVVLVGVAVGLVVSLLVGRALAPMLYHTPPHNLTVLGVVALALVIVAIIAAVGPGLRALKTDPVAALRAR
jgi:ABC-type antimicrobial peptide transport system permease subunit